MEHNTCMFCGAIISDSNPDGIGFECRKLFNEAKIDVFFANEERKNQYYNLKSETIINDLRIVAEKTKFRSEFKRNFCDSVIVQWDEKRFLSKKQCEIACSILSGSQYSVLKQYMTQCGDFVPETPFKIQQHIMLEFFKPNDDEAKSIRVHMEVLRRKLHGKN